MITDEHSLVVNRMAVEWTGRPLGAVVTLRDRTEVDELMRELTSIRGLTDALRAQQHEFANRMHTVSGLLELGRADEALRLHRGDHGCGGTIRRIGRRPDRASRDRGADPRQVHSGQ